MNIAFKITQKGVNPDKTSFTLWASHKNISALVTIFDNHRAEYLKTGWIPEEQIKITCEAQSFIADEKLILFIAEHIV